jgi:uncharacterized protein (DUF488 family)
MADTLIFSIGHSSHPYPRFLALLTGAGISAIADVRSSPYSRRFPHFHREPLQAALKADGIAYAYLGRELGGRPADARLYRDGAPDYERIAETADFRRGLERVVDGARHYRLALMCAERDPLDCHRCLLVSRALAESGVSVGHILADGGVIDHRDVEEQLLRAEGQSGDDLFLSRAERLANAYRSRAGGKTGHLPPPSEDNAA